MARPALGLMFPLAVVACSPEHPPASRNVGDGRAATLAGQSEPVASSASAGAVRTGSSGAAGATASSGTDAADAPRLARLNDSREGDAATHYGTLEVTGPCIYVAASGSRSLIASTVPGARWDSAEGVLVADGARLRPGTRISLAGSFAPAANLKGQWVDPPAEECVTPRVWVASAIRAR